RRFSRSASLPKNRGLHHRLLALSAAEKQTYIYKTVGDLKIEADVYRPPGDGPFPGILMFHGGALMGGNRNVNPKQVDRYLAEGYVIGPPITGWPRKRKPSVFSKTCVMHGTGFVRRNRCTLIRTGSRSPVALPADILRWSPDICSSHGPRRSFR